jgi:hypothetical protein
LICSIFQTFNHDYSIISLKIIKNIKDIAKKERRSILMDPKGSIFQTKCQNLKKFVFYHDFNKNNSAILIGLRK